MEYKKKWLEEVKQLQAARLNRCLITEDLGKIRSTQLHQFSNGSRKGYGFVGYLRIEDENGKISQNPTDKLINWHSCHCSGWLVAT